MYTKHKLNSSSQALNLGYKKQEERVMEQIDKENRKKVRQQGLSHLYNSDYKPAVYKKAVQFRNSMSYRIKTSQNTYRQIDLFGDTNQLKTFGLGPYFFIEFQRRILYLFLLLSIIEAICIYVNVKGTGLSDYNGSFGSYLVATTIGNYTGSVLTQYDEYFLTIIPCASYLMMFGFYIWWKCHYSSAVSEEEESREFTKPEKFCVEIEGFDQKDDVTQEELEVLFSGFGPVYEVSLARQYDGCLKYFQKLDQLEEEIKEEELEIILGSGDAENLTSLKKEKDELSKYINTLKIKPTVKSAFIHFQFQKTKVDMLQYYSDHYLFGHKNSHSCVRGICCCCVDTPEEKYLYKGKKLYVKSEKVPEPEDINWDNYEVGTCGKICRVIFSAFIIIVFLAISCMIIGLCSIYISSHSVSCEGVVIPSTIQLAKSTITTQSDKKCYCNANFISSLNNVMIKDYCSVYLNQIYTEQGIQYAITATSTIVNILFSAIVTKLVAFTQPSSLSTAYLWRTSINTIFMIFNTVFLPLLIYADIFGFKATNYVSFITIISSDIRAFFNVDSIKFYIDFQKIWYRNVSPVFTNFIIFDVIRVVIFFVIYRCMCTKESLESKEGAILQKSMNEKIISWKINASDQYAGFILIIFLSMFFSVGMPIMIPLALVNIFCRYVSNRSLLQSVSSRVPGLSQSFNSLPFSIVPILLVFSNLIGSWMLTANSKIIILQTMKITIPNINFWMLTRMLLFPFFLILAIVVVIEFLFSNIVIRFCMWISTSCHDRKDVVHPYYTREYSHYAKSMSILHSYNIRNNLKYKNVIINLEKYLLNHAAKY